MGTLQDKISANVISNVHIIFRIKCDYQWLESPQFLLNVSHPPLGENGFQLARRKKKALCVLHAPIAPWWARWMMNGKQNSPNWKTKKQEEAAALVSKCKYLPFSKHCSQATLTYMNASHIIQPCQGKTHAPRRYAHKYIFPSTFDGCIVRIALQRSTIRCCCWPGGDARIKKERKKKEKRREMYARTSINYTYTLGLNVCDLWWQTSRRTHTFTTGAQPWLFTRVAQSKCSTLSYIISIWSNLYILLEHIRHFIWCEITYYTFYIIFIFIFRWYDMSNIFYFMLLARLLLYSCCCCCCRRYHEFALTVSTVQGCPGIFHFVNW